jgi:AraC family transcriptional regulator
LDQQFILLKKGNYLAPHYTTHAMADMLVGITEYPDPIKTGVWHSHERSLISFVLKGKNLENRSGKQISRTPGDINFYHAGEPHQNIYVQFPSKHVSIELESGFYSRHALTEAKIEQAINRTPDALFLFARILKELAINDQVSQSSIETMILDLVHTSFKMEKASGSWATKIREILHDKWNEHPGLAELAKETSTHPVTISKHFRQYFSCTLGEYIRKLKVEKAMTLMKSSKTPLTDIAYACGFADQSHFSRVFKQQTGFLPKEYQKL